MSDTVKKSNADETAVADAQQAVGQLLRETREKTGTDIAAAAQILRINQRYLEALEDSRNQDLPGTTYAIGFVRSYAEHLNLDGEEIVRRYKAEATGVVSKPSLVFPKPIPDSGVPGAAVLGLGVIVAVVAYGVWYWNSNGTDVTMARVDPVPEHMAASDPETVPVTPEVASAASETSVEADAAPAPAVEAAADTAVQEPQTETAPAATVEETVAAVEATPAEAAVPTQEVTPAAAPEAVAEVAPETMPQATDAAVAAVDTATPAPATVVEAASSAAPTEQPATAEDGASRITVRATSNSWIQIRDEALDRLLFTRLLREGDQYEVPNRPGLSLMTGNAGALELLVDGEAIPAIGGVGEVRRNVVLDPDKLKAGSAVTE